MRSDAKSGYEKIASSAKTNSKRMYAYMPSEKALNERVENFGREDGN